MAEFRDPSIQGQIMLRLFLEARPLSYSELGDLLGAERRLIVSNCGELRVLGWLTRTTVEGSGRMELTVPGTARVRELFPSA